jgi:elongation factor Ts
MTDISAKAVMELRKKTGVSMMACKKALAEANGDMEAAVDILRKAGAAKADKKSDRATGEGAVAVSGRAVVSVQCETDFVARNEAFLDFVTSLAALADGDGEEAAKAKFEEQKAEMITKLGENLSFGEAVVVPGGDTFGGYVHSNNKIASVVSLTGGSEDIARDLAMHVVASSPQVISPADISDELVEKEKEIWAEQLKNEGKPEQIIEKIMIGKEKKFREENALEKQAFVKDPDVLVEKLVADAGGQIESFVRVEV